MNPHAHTHCATPELILTCMVFVILCVSYSSLLCKLRVIIVVLVSFRLAGTKYSTSATQRSFISAQVSEDLVGWLQGKNIMEEGRGRTKLLTSWWPGSRAQASDLPSNVTPLGTL